MLPGQALSNPMRCFLVDGEAPLARKRNTQALCKRIGKP